VRGSVRGHEETDRRKDEEDLIYNVWMLIIFLLYTYITWRGEGTQASKTKNNNRKGEGKKQALGRRSMSVCMFVWLLVMYGGWVMG
jgi:hypothetical protein